MLPPSRSVAVFVLAANAFDSLLLSAFVIQPALADPPKVASLTPADGAVDVDPGMTEMRIVFDRDMITGQQSVCGGGPTFPKLTEKPIWVDARTLVLKVELQPDHSYEMALNCPASGRYFRSADGEELAFMPWRFTTASKRSPKEQRAINEKSLKSLLAVLKAHYSYYDRKGVDWAAQAKSHRRKIVAAKNTQTWIRRVVKMLEPAEDPHLWMSFGGKVTATHQRNYRPNFDFRGLEKELGPLQRRNDNTFTTRTDDGIGYILISSWSNGLRPQIEELQGILAEMKDTKGLIIDVRPNGGGDELLARSVAAWFVEGDKVYSKNCYRDAKSKGGFGEMFDRVIEGNRPPKRYANPVVVLMGPANLSSCESFLLMMKQGEHVTLMGSRSGGSSGNPRPHRLENGVEIVVPSWKDFLPDDRLLEGNGVDPDQVVKVKLRELAAGDPIVLGALKLLREKSNHTAPVSPQAGR